MTVDEYGYEPEKREDANTMLPNPPKAAREDGAS